MYTSHRNNWYSHCAQQEGFLFVPFLAVKKNFKCSKYVHIILVNITVKHAFLKKPS